MNAFFFHGELTDVFLHSFLPFIRSFIHSLQDEHIYSDLAYYTELAYCLSVVPYSEPLPRTIQDALRSNRAIVITESVKPFRIVNVNKAWEDLCGYAYLEAKDMTLGSLLRGPETDTLAGNAIFAQLSRGKEAVATLTNYTKDYREFRNRLQVGPLMDGSNVTHFVGVLQEV
jgi:PAS domain S-box-containing protein